MCIHLLAPSVYTYTDTHTNKMCISRPRCMPHDPMTSFINSYILNFYGEPDNVFLGKSVHNKNRENTRGVHQC
jgi:hypothetical protein